MMLEIRLRFLTFISLFFLIVYLISFHTNNNVIFSHICSHVRPTTNNLYNSTLPSFNLPMLTEMDGTSINNEDTK